MNQRSNMLVLQPLLEAGGALEYGRMDHIKDHSDPSGYDQAHAVDFWAFVQRCLNGTNVPIAATPLCSSITTRTNVAATMTLTVSNAGPDTVSGSATTSTPFSISAGGNYTLTPGQTQAVVVSFTSKSLTTNNPGSVAFTYCGMTATTVTVWGTATP